MKGIDDARVARLDYGKIATKLVGAARSWIASRYYIGRVSASWSEQLLADQRRFMASFDAADARNTGYYGRPEHREVRTATSARSTLTRSPTAKHGAAT